MAPFKNQPFGRSLVHRFLVIIRYESAPVMTSTDQKGTSLNLAR
jgi:hypothetical protein